MSAPTMEPKLVCVTGGSGFLAGHIILELLERGYRARATVRDLKNSEKVGHLLKMAEDSKGRLELFEADLLNEASFDEAFRACDFVIHVAAVAKLTAKSPQRDIVDPSVQGTQNILDSIQRVGGIQRYVHTSSIAAVLPTNTDDQTVYDEQSWNDDATLKSNPYGLAKTQAERRVWSFLEGLNESERFQAIAINPALIIGPVLAKRHLRASPMVIHDLLVGKFPACPQFSFGVVDVREVAKAHVEALTLEDPARRYILCHKSLWMIEIANELRKLYPQFRIPRFQLPNLFMYVMALFDKRLSFANLRSLLGRKTQLNNSLSQQLKIRYRPVSESLKDCCDSMLDQGFAHPKKH